MSFKSLVSVISEQRQEIKQALASFPYFETWEPDLIAECCRVSSIVEFPLNEIILGPDVGNSHEVYFILEGTCKMLRNLFFTVKRGSNEKKMFYKLCKDYPMKTSDSELKNECYVSRLLNEKQGKSEIGCYREEPNNEMRTKENPSEIYFSHEEASNNETSDAAPEMNNENEVGSQNTEAKPLEPLKSEMESMKIQVAAQKETTFEVDHHVMVLEECKKRKEKTSRVIKNTTPSEKPKNAKCFFMQVGFLLKGACFGLGKHYKNMTTVTFTPKNDNNSFSVFEKLESENFILTASRVKCLKIPRGFLVQHSPCNIWNRICLFHSLHLPSKEHIFDCFKSDRIWMERKQAQTANIISLKNLPRSTSASEVPYSIRLSETNHFLLI